MSGIYHTRGFMWASVHGGLWHLREIVRNRRYRALHWFNWRLKRVGSGPDKKLSYAGKPINLVHGPSFLSAWDEIFVNEIYDIGDINGHQPVFIDCGANIGLAALYWSVRYPGFRYLGFEPDPIVAECCRKNLHAWGIRGELVEAGLSEKEGLSHFVRDGADGGYLVKHAGSEKTSCVVKVVRLSHYLPACIDLLKLDIEGAEGVVLEEILPLLGRIKRIFIEWHSRAGQQGLGRAIDVLENAGFDCHIQVAAGIRHPFRSRVYKETVFQNINIFGARP